MRIPATPPDYRQLMQQIPGDRLIKLLSDLDPRVRGKYRHWDKLRHMPTPNGLNHEEWWLRLKMARESNYETTPFQDNAGRAGVYLVDGPIQASLHNIDLTAGGRIDFPEQITNPETRDRYFVNSLIEEAITSSQLEGANTTRRVAKEMIRTNRPPIDKSERMILNNFLTMKKVTEIKKQALTMELILETHKLVTEGTLDDPTAAGRLRQDIPEEEVTVSDMEGNILHRPPPAAALEARMKEMCRFANEETPEHFLHPVIRSIILHFWLAYDHPFVDGNGRTARALFYWSMLHYGYWLFEFISISHVIRRAPIKYGRAFLHSEVDGCDLTYFIEYHFDVINQAIRQLQEYIQRKTKELKDLDRELRGISAFNHRQKALISNALRHPEADYTIESHRLSHGVVYQTARTDLIDLEQRGLLNVVKIGKTLHYRPSPDIRDRLMSLD